MARKIAKEVVAAVMARLGHAIIEERTDQIVFKDGDTGSYMTIVFENGEIQVDHLIDNLSYEGIDPDVFFAEMETM